MKRIRKSKGLSQEALMAIAGVHRTQISEYERGETAPQVDIVDRLSRALKVPIGNLLAGLGWQEPPES